MQCGHDVCVAGIWSEHREIEFAFMGGFHDGAIGIADSDWVAGGSFVEDGAPDAYVRGRTASVGI